MALIFKIRKTKTFDNETLYGDDLELFKKHNQVICLIENDTKYYFRVNELMKIWNVGLIKIQISNLNQYILEILSHKKIFKTQSI